MSGAVGLCPRAVLGVGLFHAMLDDVIPYLHQRKQFGKPIGDFQL